jgi:cytochrome oxidase Cu insertion factor (SCO1/SenC/PrrC family)
VSDERYLSVGESSKFPFSPRARVETVRKRPKSRPRVFGAFSPALAEGSAEPSATELIEALLARRQPVGAPFDLIDHTGRGRTDADFRGKLVVIYFGYTNCPDVCPTELQAISLALDALGTAAALVQPLFITVDPERDTPSVLADYVSSFHARLVALTGSAQAIRSVALAYKVFFAKSATVGPDGYAIDHTGFIYLVGKDGRYIDFLPPGLAPERIVEALRLHLDRQNGP